MVEMTGTSVIKTFEHQDACAKVKHLEVIYALINTHSIPNTDELIRVKGETVYLKPRGIASRPRVENELRECLICVLNALVVRIDYFYFLFLRQLLISFRLPIKSNYIIAIFSGRILFAEQTMSPSGF